MSPAPLAPVAAAFAVITLFFAVPFSPLLREKQTITQRFLSSGGSITERKIIWKTTARMIQQSRGLGAGLGQFKLQYLSVYARHPVEIKKLAYESDFPRQNVTEAHNEYLHVFAETGLPGLFAFLWLCAYVFLRGWKRLSRADTPRQSPLYPAALSGFLSLCLTSFFGFPIHLPQTLALFCLLSAYLVRHSDEQLKPSGGAPSPASFLFAALCVFAAVFVATFSFKTLLSSVYLRHARNAQAAREHGLAQEKFGKALSLSPRDGETLFYYGMFLLQLGKPGEAHGAFTEAEKTVSNLNLIMALAKTAHVLKRHEEALQKYNFVLQIYPWKEYQCAAHSEIGNIYILQRKRADAVKALTKGLDFCDKKEQQEEIQLKLKMLRKNSGATP